MANPFAVDVPQFSPLQELMGGYKVVQGFQQDRALDAAARAIRSGDNDAAVEALFNARQIGSAIEFAKLNRQQDASNQFSSDLAGVFGQQQGQPVQQSPLARLMSPPQAQPQLAPPPVAAPAAQLGPSSNLTAPETTITGVHYGPITNPQTNQVIAPGAGYVPEPHQVAQAQVPGQQAQVPGQIGPAPSLGGVSLDKAVPTLLRAASNPSLPKEQQETARMLLGKALDQYPQEVRKLEIFKQRPDLFELALQEKRAGSTLINTAEGQEAAQSKARIAIDTHAVQDLSKKVAAGHAAVPLLNQMLAMNDKVPGGWAAAVSPFLARAASGLGIPVTEGMSNAELLSSMSRQFIPSVRDPGATSNYEQQLYTQAVPSLSQSTEGRAKIANMFKAQITRNQEALAIYRKHVGAPELDDKLRELDNKPMFSATDRKFLEGASPQSPSAPRRMKFNPATGELE